MSIKGEQVIVSYQSESEMQTAINEWSVKGWKAVNTTVEKEPYKATRGCCLFVIFAPLALFARGKNKYLVTYEYVGIKTNEKISKVESKG